MGAQSIQHNANLEQSRILSPALLAFLKQKIKELGQEKNEQIIIESIQMVADEISAKQNIGAKAIQDEVEEKLKGELATKDFVRAEVSQVRAEIAESHKKQMWLIISTGAVSAITIIGANYALIKFLIDTFFIALNAK